MKKILFLTLIITFLFSCVNKSEYEKVKLENKKLKAELNEIKNGAKFRLNEIVANFENKNYLKLKILVDSLVQIHPNSEESKKAISINEEVQKILFEKEKIEEEERLLREKDREKTKKEKLRQIIRIKQFYTSKPNSAGGVDFNIIWQNKSEKTIKYAYFMVVPYNGVGDIVKCTIKGESYFKGQVTGPIEKEKWSGYNSAWTNAWYNNTIRKIMITKIEIEYIDGTSEKILPDNINMVIY